MPIYEYDCSSCGKRVETIQKFSDSPLTDCPECGAAGSLMKSVSLSSFALKGTGWYTTDYKKGPAISPTASNTAPASGTPSPPTSPNPAATPASTSSSSSSSPSSSSPSAAPVAKPTPSTGSSSSDSR